MRARPVRLGTALGALAALVVLPAAPAAAQPVDCSTRDPDKVVTTSSANVAFQAMKVNAAARAGVRASRQIVAVLGEPMSVSTEVGYLRGAYAVGRTAADQQYDQPSMVAGLVAGTRGPKGPVGVAPGAQVVGVGVYDPTSDNPVVTPDGLAEGIQQALDQRARTIVVAVAAAESSPALEQAVLRAEARDALIVAAVTPPATDEPAAADAAPEELTPYPAALDGVLGVGLASSEGFAVVPSDALDVVAPVLGAVVTTVNGSLCDVDSQVASASLAAGEVGGLAVLLRAAYAENAAQIAARITATAAGSGDRDSLNGYGTVQAEQAMTRTLQIDASGDLLGPEPAVERAPAVLPPRPEVDRFAQFRTSLLWWGVLAGGGLVLALVLRPLLRR